jgi:kinetochor protein Mis14/NSL1
MDDGHRKIELQSPDDLTFLMDNVSRLARDRIDLHLPPSAAPEGEDALRRRVEELVQEVTVPFHCL